MEIFPSSSKAGIPVKRISTMLSAAVNAFTYTTGDDGLPLNGISGELQIVVPAGCSAPTGTNAALYGRINGIITGYHSPYGGSDNTDHLYLANIRNQFAAVNIELNVLHGGALLVLASFGYSDGTSFGTPAPSIGGLLSGVSSITSLYGYLSSSYTFPAGTMLEYWEVAA
jgi:hypothetical protein